MVRIVLDCCMNALATNREAVIQLYFINLIECLISWTLIFSECGFPVMRNKQGTEDLGKMASGGDWPWHVALFKDGVHICDATIATLSWLITTASCFQG